jgi:hypothetical protein
LFKNKRKDDEDPFAALRDGGTYQSTPTSSPDIGLGSASEPTPGSAVVTASRALGTPTASATSPPPAAAVTQTAPITSHAAATQPEPASPPTPRFDPLSFTAPLSTARRSIGLGGAAFPIFARVIAACIVIAAVAIPISTIGSAPHVKIPSFNLNTPTTGASGGAGGGSQARQTSYLTAAGLRAGLAHVARLAPGGTFSLLRIDSHSLNVTAFLRNGKIEQIYFGPNGTFTVGVSSTGQRGLPLSRVKISALARIEAGMRRKFHVPPSRIDYMVLSSPSGVPAEWIVFADTPSHPGFSASLAGTGLKRLGT